MAQACTWKAYNGAPCPYVATSTGARWGEHRWLCDHHVDCPDGKTGDLIVFDGLNKKRAQEKQGDESAEENVDRVQRLKRRAEWRAGALGTELYNDGTQRAVARGLVGDARHAYACAFMVVKLSRSDMAI